MSTYTATQTETVSRTAKVARAAGFWAPIILIPSLILGINLLGMGHDARTNYADGYCTALGGTVLNSETCNVNGAVVAITGSNDSLVQVIDGQDAFANGYCTALGGIAINGENCNVNGKVVTVPEHSK